ncbi:hypothetical protein NSU_3505 [Novosphingobium pentaromativorans US6-1]|uniref:Uncharacterized protein n=1 Tax=Novosphingobium pentaromativorans US6-1 TaxID=1088721 RepID=G6EGH1_9SPHN|nr:hypothetical protein NSU_3505 [Novosphingobium pentaromativorans US6-1]
MRPESEAGEPASMACRVRLIGQGDSALRFSSGKFVPGLGIAVARPGCR